MSATTNLADFSVARRVELQKILTSWEQHGLPEGFGLEDVHPAFNTSSGYVWLENSEYQVAMLDGEVLRLWHSLPGTGKEAFLADILAECSPDELNETDFFYLWSQPEFKKLLTSGNYPAWQDLEEPGEE